MDVETQLDRGRARNTWLKVNLRHDQETTKCCWSICTNIWTNIWTNVFAGICKVRHLKLVPVSADICWQPKTLRVRTALELRWQKKVGLPPPNPHSWGCTGRCIWRRRGAWDVFRSWQQMCVHWMVRHASVCAMSGVRCISVCNGIIFHFHSNIKLINHKIKNCGVSN